MTAREDDMGGPIELNGVVVYAYVVADEKGARVRVSADDWERLGLAPGARVRVAPSGREAEALLLIAAEQQPPVVWLHFQRLTARRAG
jgi:hypothetical protein